MQGDLLLAETQSADTGRATSGVAVSASVGSPSRCARIAILATLVVVLELFLFRATILGAIVPPWDFMGSYNTDAYYWLAHGSFFSPVEWVPSTWAGYPGAAILQNSAWYLPATLVSAALPYTLHVAAALAAGHAAWGLVGAYLLARRLLGDFWVSAFAGVAWFFAAGTFSNASHIDIARGYAWMPWVMLALSSRWRWTSWWQAPLAALVLWQATTAMYPGSVIALAYVAVIWVAYWQWVDRPRLRQYLVPLLVTGVAVALLSAPRLVPYYLLGAGGMTNPPDDSLFSPFMVGTLLFGYGSPGLPNDITMRSFFLPATVLAMVAWAPLRSRTTGAGLALVLPALALGIPALPWFAASQSLPGLAFSRFGMSDFKVFLLLGLVLVSAAGVGHLRTHRTTLRNRSGAVRAGATFLVVALMLELGVQGPFSLPDWAPQWCLLLLAVSVLLAAGRALSGDALIGVLVLLTAVSGAMWAQDSAVTWQAPRLATEQATYGATVDQLISTQRPSAAVQRPARAALPAGYTSGTLHGNNWNAVYFNGQLAVGGYVNLRSFKSQGELEAALLDPAEGTTYSRFVTAPGMAVTRQGRGPVTGVGVARCLDGRRCGPADITPVSYRPGALSYRVSSDVPAVALFNEAFYRGWRAEVCLTNGPCSTVRVAGSKQGLLSASLPSGDYTLALTYHTPGMRVGWVAFASAVSLLVLWVGGTLTLRRRRGRLVDGPRHGDSHG
jgi:hypothetical protein